MNVRGDASFCPFEDEELCPITPKTLETPIIMGFSRFEKAS